MHTQSIAASIHNTNNSSIHVLPGDDCYTISAGDPSTEKSLELKRLMLLKKGGAVLS